MNAYYQVINQDGKCAVKLFPATDGGEQIRKDEIFDYLCAKNISFDAKGLVEAFTNLSEVCVFPTTTDFKIAEGEYAVVTVSPDNMTCVARLIPPFEGGGKMTWDEFMREFKSRGIVYGFDEDAITAFLNDRKYCTDVIAAKGTPPVHGIDASIEYFFNVDPKVRPTLKEDGSVDFFNLNTINHCRKGDKLAKLTPAVIGEPGKNVRNEYIRPHEARPAMLKYGNNITISEDKTEIFSDVDGHVNLVEGKVFVSNVFEVENVDNSVGNIEYDGNVCVNGNVCENFSIKAHGNIEVRGVVEGAKLEADGDIIIARGMNGMHKGELKAEGNIVSKFLENAKVVAGGYVESESILHSEVVAGEEIKVTGKRGFIAGGKCSANSTIEVKNLGSEMGADTIVEVGMDAKVKLEVVALQKEIVDINKQLGTIKPVLEGAKAKLQNGIKMTQDQLLQIQKLAVVSKERTARLNECMEQLGKLQDSDDTSTKGQVIVTGDVFPGTKICIGDVSMVVKASMKYCRFVKEGGEVKMVAIY